MIILAAAIILALNGSGIIGRSNEATLKNDLKVMEEELSVKISEAILRGTPDEFEGKKAEDVIETAKKYPGKYVISDRKLVDPSTLIVPEWKLPDGDETIEVGDLLTPTVEGLETEKFYVIADDGVTLTLLAEKCINTDTYKQSDDTDTIMFDGGYCQDDEYGIYTCYDGTNIYAKSDVKYTVKNYINSTLKKLTLLDVEEEYQGTAVPGVKARLMWEEEVENTTFKAASNYNDIIYGTKYHYWLGTPKPNYGPTYVAYVTIFYYGVEADQASYGEYLVRPVIEISKSLVE